MKVDLILVWYFGIKNYKWGLWKKINSHDHYLFNVLPTNFNLCNYEGSDFTFLYLILNGYHKLSYTAQLSAPQKRMWWCHGSNYVFIQKSKKSISYAFDILIKWNITKHKNWANNQWMFKNHLFQYKNYVSIFESMLLL